MKSEQISFVVYYDNRYRSYLLLVDRLTMDPGSSKILTGRYCIELRKLYLLLSTGIRSVFVFSHRLYLNHMVSSQNAVVVRMGEIKKRDFDFNDFLSGVIKAL